MSWLPYLIWSDTNQTYTYNTHVVHLYEMYDDASYDKRTFEYTTKVRIQILSG